VFLKRSRNYFYQSRIVAIGFALKQEKKTGRRGRRSEEKKNPNPSENCGWRMRYGCGKIAQGGVNPT